MFSGSVKMGKSMFNFGKQGKERARQQKQMDKAAKRLMVKQQKAYLKTGGSGTATGAAEPVPVEQDSGDGSAQQSGIVPVMRNG